MSLLEKVEMTLTAAALAEEGDADTARRLEAEIENHQVRSRERRAGSPMGDRGSRRRRGLAPPCPSASPGRGRKRGST